MTRQTTLGSIALALPLLAASCASRSVELTAPDPNVIGTLHEQVLQIAVDEQRVYFLTRGIGGSQASAGLRSCAKDHCGSSLITYSQEAADATAGFGLSNGQVYWFERFETTERLVSCPSSGCAGSPRNVSDPALVSSSVLLTEAVFDADSAYFCRYADPNEHGFSGNVGERIVRVPLSGSNASPELVATAGRVLSLTVQDDYVYWLGHDLPQQNPADVFIARARKDGAGGTEQLASRIRWLPQSAGAIQSPHLGLAVAGGFVYWSENIILGSIKRCPISGCAGEPEIVATPLAFPLGLMIDGSNLYWAYRGDAFSYSIASCTAANCEPLGLVHGSTAGNALTHDDSYFYTATTETPFNDYDQWHDIEATIRRFPTSVVGQ